MKGFTLIELLIVVAIIGILAAIAVPNFMNAQTRAKITRVQSDLRAIGTAQEMYRTDWSRYTPCADVASGAIKPDRWQRLIGLTTPIAYMATLPADVFSDRSKPLADASGGDVLLIPKPCYNYLEAYTYRETDGWPASPQVGPWFARVFKRFSMIITSRGPSGVVPNLQELLQDDEPQKTSAVYNSSNGTTSVGYILYVQ